MVLSPRRVACGLVTAIVVLLLLHGASQVARFGFGRPTLWGLSSRVYFGAEASIPAWFSSSLLLTCSVLLLWIAGETRRRERGAVRWWTALGLIFLALSVDEAAALHEMVSPAFAGVVERLSDTVGWGFVALARKPGYAWAFPGLLLTIALGIACLSFLRTLPHRTRRLFVVAGAVFVSGAIGAELVGGWYSGEFGPDSVVFALVLTLEETLEMVGLAVFVYALLAYMQEAFGAVEVAFSDSGSNATRAASLPERPSNVLVSGESPLPAATIDARRELAAPPSGHA